MSNLQNFVRLVAKLRKAQKSAKKFGMQSQVAAAEKLEAEVDKELEQMGFEGAKIKQMRLDALDPKKTDEEQGTYATNTQT